MTMTGHTDDRGQLILAGAVVFSLVLIGIVVVFSTTLFTANMASSSANAGISDSASAESDVNLAAEELLVRVNEQNDWLLDQGETFADREYNNDIDILEDDFEESIGVHRDLHADRQASSGPTIVDSQLAESDPIQEGQRVGGDQGDIDGLLFGENIFTDRNVDEFVLLVDGEQDGEVEFRIEGENGIERFVGVEVLDGELDVDSTDDENTLFDSPMCEGIEPVDGTVYVDLTGGFVAGDPHDPDDANSCEDLESIKDDLDPDYDIDARDNVLNLQYEFEFTVNESLDELPGDADAESVIWSSTVESVYETRTVERSVTIETSGYNKS